MINKKISNKNYREFGLLVGSILSGISLIPLIKHNPVNFWLLIIGVFLMTTSILLPLALKPFYTIWMAFGHVMGRISSFLILSIVYYLILTPMSLFKKILGKSDSVFKFKINTDTYWIKKSPVDHQISMRRPF